MPPTIILLLYIIISTAANATTTPGRVQFDRKSYSIDEDTEGIVTVTLRRVNGTDGAISAYVWTRDLSDSAIESIDYIPIVNQSVSWADSDSSDKHVLVKIVDDSLYEATDESFVVEIRTVSGDATIYEDYNTTTITINANSDRKSNRNIIL